MVGCVTYGDVHLPVNTSAAWRAHHKLTFFRPSSDLIFSKTCFSIRTRDGSLSAYHTRVLLVQLFSYDLMAAGKFGTTTTAFLVIAAMVPAVSCHPALSPATNGGEAEQCVHRCTREMLACKASLERASVATTTGGARLST